MMHLPPTALRGLTSLTSFVAFRQWESGGGDDWQEVGWFMIADTLKHSTSLVRRFAGKSTNYVGLSSKPRLITGGELLI
jgi:hypothetical protein